MLFRVNKTITILFSHGRILIYLLSNIVYLFIIIILLDKPFCRAKFDASLYVYVLYFFTCIYLNLHLHLYFYIFVL